MGRREARTLTQSSGGGEVSSRAFEPIAAYSQGQRHASQSLSEREREREGLCTRSESSSGFGSSSLHHLHLLPLECECDQHSPLAHSTHFRTRQVISSTDTDTLRVVLRMCTQAHLTLLERCVAFKSMHIVPTAQPCVLSIHHGSSPGFSATRRSCMRGLCSVGITPR